MSSRRVASARKLLKQLSPGQRSQIRRASREVAEHAQGESQEEMRRVEKAVVRKYARMYGVPKRVIVDAMLYEKSRVEQSEAPARWASDDAAMKDPVLKEESARTWLDAFPWIQTAVRLATDGDTEGEWWNEPLDPPNSYERRCRLAQISELALVNLSTWTVGEIFPGLAGDTVLMKLPFGTRAHNEMLRKRCYVASDFQNEELADLLTWRQVGVGTVHTILQTLADASTTSAAPIVLPAQPSGTGRHWRSNEQELPAREQSVIDDLRNIAEWYVTIGYPTNVLLGQPLTKGTPADIVKARQRLDLITASNLLDQADTTLDAAELLDCAMSELDDRAREILARRVFADQPEKLDRLGAEMGVTRERVRQIEGRARATMVEFLAPGNTLGLVASAARDVIGTTCRLNDVLGLLPALSKRVEAAAQPAWRVLDRLDDAYEIKDGWCAAPTLAAAQTATQTCMQELADSYGVVRIEDVDLVYGGAETNRTEVNREWLVYCGYVVKPGFVLTRTQSVSDRAAGYLSIIGSPMSSQEILDQFVVERSLSSLRTALAADSRFERVDRDRWALKEWGLETYAGVRALIREEVARQGGQVSLDALVQHITGRYTVTASSVVAYASAPPFENTGGFVRLARVDHQTRKSPERTRRLYRRGNAWIYRVRITKEHLRGSGSVAPVAIASILDMHYGETRLLNSDLGSQSINWTGTQPGFGTIRRFLLAKDVAINDEVFLVIGDDGTFAVELIPPLAGDPLKDALTLIGVAPGDSNADARAVLTGAIGLPAESPSDSIIGAYRDRGDSDVADLLIDAKSELDGVEAPGHLVAPTTEVEEILDLL
jgi:hypothetical protein